MIWLYPNLWYPKEPDRRGLPSSNARQSDEAEAPLRSHLGMQLSGVPGCHYTPGMSLLVQGPFSDEGGALLQEILDKLWFSVGAGGRAGQLRHCVRCEAAPVVVGQSRVWGLWVPQLYFCASIHCLFLSLQQLFGGMQWQQCHARFGLVSVTAWWGRRRWRRMMRRGDGGQGWTKDQPGHDRSALMSWPCCGWGRSCYSFSPSFIPPSLSGVACSPSAVSRKVPACPAL